MFGLQRFLPQRIGAWSNSKFCGTSCTSEKNGHSKSEMNVGKTLVGIDFDHTLLNANSDVRLKTLVSNAVLPKKAEVLSNGKNGWTAYMREIFLFLHQNGITPDDYHRCLSEMPLMPGMKELLVDAHSTGQFEIVILSDANSYFINYVLDHHGLSGTVQEVFTNPATFRDNGCLTIQEYQDQDWCDRCSRNMCKGSVLENYLARRTSDGHAYRRVAFVGDGSNDVCPALKLKAGDYAFARKGYPMLRKLKKLPEGNVRASVVVWETGEDIRKVLLPGIV